MAQALKELAAGSKGKAPLAHGVGRRKSSVARIWLRRGRGAVRVNTKDITDYFDTGIDIQNAETPLRVVPSMGESYDVQVNVSGGGKAAQADAVKLAIARGFLQLDESLRPILRKQQVLTVDARQKERKKPGRKGARRRFQFVKR